MKSPNIEHHQDENPSEPEDGPVLSQRTASATLDMLANSRARMQQKRFKPIPPNKPVATGIDVLDNANDVQRIYLGDLLRIAGPTLVGKTQLLYQLVAIAIAPPPHGRGAHVCFFQQAENAQRSRIASLVRARILSTQSTINIDQAVNKSLARLAFYRVHNTLQLCASFYALQSYLESRQGSYGAL